MLLWQLKLDLQKRETKVAFGIMMAMAVISFAFSIDAAFLHGGDVSGMMPAYAYGMMHMSIFQTVGLIYVILAPLAAGIPFSGGLGENGTLGYGSILLERCSKGRLIAARAGSAFVVGAMTVALPAVLNLIWCVIAFPLNSVCNPIGASSSMPVVDYFLSKVYLTNLYCAHPYLYSFLGLAAVALYGGVCALATFALSLRIDKHRLFLSAVPFLLILLVSMLCEFFVGIKGGAMHLPTVYMYFLTADDSSKIPLPIFATIFALITAAICISIGGCARRKDEL